MEFPIDNIQGGFELKQRDPALYPISQQELKNNINRLEAVGESTEDYVNSIFQNSLKRGEAHSHFNQKEWVSPFQKRVISEKIAR